MIAAAILIFLLAALLLWWGHTEKVRSGLPLGKLVTVDLHDNQTPQKPLFSKHYHLVGMPDYLIRQGKQWIPFEVKTVSDFRAPYEGHIFQLLAYCLLVEENYGIRPPYGYLQYRSRSLGKDGGVTIQIEFNSQMSEKLLFLLARMRQAEQQENIPRSHQEPARCRSCGYSSICDQRL